MKYEIRFVDGTIEVVEAVAVQFDELGPDYGCKPIDGLGLLSHEVGRELMAQSMGGDQ